jgi:pimeloyl-ACP methyl ester carboxylesterase
MQQQTHTTHAAPTHAIVPVTEPKSKHVVLLHGWGGSDAIVWKTNRWYERLEAAGYAVTGIDLPGHGSSQRKHDPQAYADLASLVAAQMPAAESVIGIGYSLGAKVLLELASRQPSTFRVLVLAGLGANVFAPEVVGEVLARALVDGADDATPAPVRALVTYGLRAGNDPLALAACLRRPANPVLTPSRLGAITCPALLVCGDRDSLALPLEPLSSALANSTTLLLPGVNHIGLPASPECATAVIDFLDEHAPAGEHRL